MRKVSGYVVMYRDLLLCKWLTPTDKLVYTMIADKYDFASKVGKLTEQKMLDLSIRRLSEQSGIDRRAIRKSIDKLCDIGFITEQKTFGGKSYYVAIVQLHEVSDFIKLCDSCGGYQKSKKNTA